MRLLALTLLTIFALASCGGGGAEFPDPAEGPRVNYDDLGYESGVYTYEGEPFTGHSTQYHSDGTTVKSELDFSLGKRHGLGEEFAENGTRIVECHYHNDQQHGTNTYWDEDGNLIKRQIYEHGEAISTEKFGSLAGDDQ